MISFPPNRTLYLASKSPRRRELLTNAGIPFQVIDSDWDEVYAEEMPLDKVPRYLSFNKAYNVRESIGGNDLILTADTVVIKDEKLLGKPKDKLHAIEMLNLLSDTDHDVITGITVMSNQKIVNAVALSKVRFSPLSPTELEYYIENFKPFDKAGAYGIQDWLGLCKVVQIEGSYTNVMGLPMHLVYQILSNW